MLTSTHTLKRRPRIAQMPATTMLAGKLFKQTWGLLLVTLCGMVACVGLICAVPLLSQAVIQTGLQGVMKSVHDGSIATTIVASDHPTTTLIQQTGHTIDQVMQSNLSNFLGGNPTFSLSTPDLQLLDTQTGKALANQNVSVLGYDPSQLSQNVTVLQGRLPGTSPVVDELEIVVTQSIANKLGLHVGTQQQVRYPVSAGSTVWRLHVVGIVSIKSSAEDFWHDTNSSSFGPLFGPGAISTQDTDSILASLPAMMPLVSAIQIVPQSTSIGNTGNLPEIAGAPTALTSSLTSTQKATNRLLQFTSSNSGGINIPVFTFYWNYPLNLSRIDGNNLGGFLTPFDAVNMLFYQRVQNQHILSPMIRSALSSRLYGYKSSIITEQVAVTLLLVSILGLALFLVSVLANVLVERQLATIVMLRGRGATLSHIFGAFTLHGLLVGLIALLLGPACAILLVTFIGQSLMPASSPSIFAVVTHDLLHTIGQIWIFAVVTVVVASIVLVISLRRASRIDLVTLRQNTSREQRAPLWKRLYLDFFLLALLVLGLVYYQFMFQSGVGTDISLAPLAFIAIPVLLFSCTLFFLRFFPAITRLGTWLATKMRPAPGVLAFAQMERQPHATLRMILLLALALSSSIYLLSFMTAQQERIQQVIGSQVGADFSGTIDVKDAKQTLKNLQTHYSSLPGVAAATLGYHDVVNISDNIPIFVNAVDADTYAQTAMWSPLYTTESLQSLTSQLVAHRASAIAQNQVYAIVNPDLWTELHLSSGKTFTLPMSSKSSPQIQYVALMEAKALPRLNTQATNSYWAGDMLLDYQNYAAVLAKAQPGTQVQPNYVWLSAHDDAHSRAQVKQNVPNLQDLQALIVQAANEPLQIVVKGIFILGLIVALALALIGVGLTAWLSVKRRLVSFSILRAMGMSPGQIAQTLFWEQGMIYLSSLIIGLGIGWLSTLLVTPAFTLMDSYLIMVNPLMVNSYLPLLKNVSLPPLWIGLMLIGFVVICGSVLLFMSRYVARAAVSQTLRLNED